jgi:hypothetical protein
VSQLTAAQLAALRALRPAYPDAEIAIIGAAALAFHIDMTWRTSVDLDLVIAVSVAPAFSHGPVLNFAVVCARAVAFPCSKGAAHGP